MKLDGAQCEMYGDAWSYWIDQEAIDNKIKKYKV